LIGPFSAIAAAPALSPAPVDARRLSGHGHAAAYSVVLVEGLDALRGLESDWRRLADASTTGNPFLAWEWTFTWAEQMMGDRLVTAIVRDAEQVVAIALFYRNSYAIGPAIRGTCLQLYGPRELQHVFELRQIPMLAGHEEPIMRVLLAQLLKSARWDWLEIASYGPAEMDWRDVLHSPPPGMRLVAEDTFQVPVLRLLGSWDEQRTALRRNVKERIRRGYNSLKRDGVKVDVVIDTDPANCEVRLAEFHHLHEQRAQVRDRKAHVNSFHHMRLRRFLDTGCARLMRAGVLSFARLEADGKVVATRMVLERDGSTYLYYSGFEPAWWNHSVMTVLVTEVVKRAIGRGHASVNFSPGLDQFKSGWTEPAGQMRTDAFMLGRETPAARLRLAAFRRRKRITSSLVTLARRMRERAAPARQGATASEANA
jgi:CelD/BcsL family acetyltransferase involved in cellulose biosynthesis